MKTGWYWYVMRPNEIVVDIDSKKAMTRAFHVLRRAMRKDYGNGQLFRNRLNVSSVWLYGSLTRGHAHLIIVTTDCMDVSLRTSWALWMGSDQLRAAYVLERSRYRHDGAELLCSRKPYGFRSHDDVCECKGKHKPKRVTDGCPAMARLLGPHRSADYFPRNNDRVLRAPIYVPYGQVSLNQIKKWRGV